MGRTIELEGETSVGRDNADIVLDDEEVSRRHALLRPVPGGVEVKDLGSTNGTYLEGRQLAAPGTAAPGETIRFGQSSARVLGATTGGPTRLDSRPPTGAAATQLRGHEVETPEAPPASEKPPPEARLAPRPARETPEPEPVEPFSVPGASVPPPRRAATRLVLPEIFTFATVIAVAVALVVYFASR